MEEARLWRARFRGEIPPREADFLDAVIELATRATRIKRRIVTGVIALLAVLVVAAGAALWTIRNETAKAKAATDAALSAKADEEKQRKLADEARLVAETSLKELEEANEARDKAEVAAATGKINLANKTKEATKQTLLARQAAEAAKRNAAEAAKAKARLAAEAAKKNKQAAEEAARRGKHIKTLD